MQSCDNLLLSQMFKNISYEQIILSNAISNNLREVNYAGQKIYIPEGRGYLDFCYALKKLGIKYEELSIQQLIDMNVFKDIMVLVPATYLKNYEKLKMHIVQFSPLYSAFKIVSFDGINFILSLAESRNSYSVQISLEKLRSISQLQIKPLEKALKIIKFNNSDLDIKKETIIFNMKDKIYNCINDFEELSDGTLCKGGRSFYRKFLELIGNILFNENDNAAERMKRFIFCSIIRSGGECFYRKDFVETLEKNILTKDIINNHIIESLTKASDEWRQIIIILGNIQSNLTGIRCCEIYNRIKDIISRIEDAELTALNSLYVSIS